MATVEKTPRFAIEAEADTLLNRLSDVVAHFVLLRAAAKTTNQTGTGVPLVTESDIRESAELLARFLAAACDQEDYPEDLRGILRTWKSALEESLAQTPNAAEA